MGGKTSKAAAEPDFKPVEVEEEAPEEVVETAEIQLSRVEELIKRISESDPSLTALSADMFPDEADLIADRIYQEKAAEFAEADADESGEMDLEEAMAQGMTESQFKQMDADGSGAISKAEFGKFHAKMESKEGRSKTFARVMHALATNTAIVSVSGAGLSFSDDVVLALASALAENETIREVNLSGNDLEEAGFEALAMALRSSRSIKRVDVSGQLRAPSTAAVSILLSAIGSNLTTTELVVDCKDDKLKKQIAQVLKFNAKLEKRAQTSVAIPDPATLTGVKQYIASLATDLSITTVDLKKGTKFFLAFESLPEEWKHTMLCECLAESSVKMIDLTGLKLGNKFAELFAVTALPRNRNLETVLLSGNSISTGGVEALGEGLANSSVVTIDLTKQSLTVGKAGIRALIAAGDTNRKLLNIKVEMPTDEVKKEYEAMLGRNRDAKKLSVSLSATKKDDRPGQIDIFG